MIALNQPRESCFDVKCSETALSVFVTQQSGGLYFVAEFLVDLVDADVGGRAGSEAAVGVECDAGRFEKLHGLLDAGDDGLRRIDNARLCRDAAETYFEIVPQSFEHGHVAGAGCGEFHG